MDKGDANCGDAEWKLAVDFANGDGERGPQAADKGGELSALGLVLVHRGAYCGPSSQALSGVSHR